MLLTAFCKKLCPDLETVSKSVRMMKIVALFLLAGCMQLSAKTAAQGLSLSLSNVPISTAFNEIQQQTAYRFVYTNEQLSATSKITLTVQNASIEKVLELCFKDQPLTWSIEDKFIIVKTKEKKMIDPTIIDNEIRGKVTNDKNEPVAGATISLKGSKKATGTDNKGEFVLADVLSGSVIVVSSIGFESQEIIVGNNRFLTIRLQNSVSALDEMVIKGYYSTSKRLNTGSVSKITAEEISRQPVSNVLTALEGRMSGVYVQQTTGVPGGSINIQIRGKNSLRTAGNYPLYIIDGVPFTSTSLSSSNTPTTIFGGAGNNPLDYINPSDIESLEILKDADATAIYGSRGSNGVILISTKKGSAGKTKFILNAYTGWEKVAHNIQLLNTNQYLQMRHEAFANDSASPGTRDYDINGKWDTTRYSDWQKYLIGSTSHINNMQASVSGGAANTQFLFGIGYFRESTVFSNLFFNQKSSCHFNLNHISDNQKLTLNLSFNYLFNNNTLPQTDFTGQALSLAPDAPTVYDQNGKLNWENSTWTNPQSSFLKKYTGTTNNFIANVNLGYRILKGLQFKTAFGYNSLQLSEISTIPINSWNPAFLVTTGSSFFANTNIKTWIIEPQLQYDRAFGNGKINVLFGTTFQENKQDAQTIGATGFSNDALLENIKAASSIYLSDANYIQYRYTAIFGRLNYMWKDRYLANITARRDGSSRFGPGKKFGNFGAVGAAWIFSNEKFFKKYTPLVSYGKIRVSAGTTGSDQLTDYQYLSTYTTASYAYQNNTGIIPTRLVNPDYSWETNTKIEGAIELGFLKDKILFTASYYRNQSSNQLVGYSLPLVTGFSSIQYNLPAKVQNTGAEIELSTVNIKSAHLSWITNINLTVPKNKLVAYPNIESSSYASVYAVGKSLYIQNKYHFLNVDPQTGIYTLEDVDGNGIINSKDRQFLKEIKQCFFGGFRNNFSYKGLQLDIFFQFVKQTGTLPQNSPPGLLGNQPVETLNRWQNPGDQTTTAKFTQKFSGIVANSFNNAYIIGDKGIVDASFLRLKNVSLSWQAPIGWCSKIKADNLRIYVQAQNLFTVTNYKGLDPENQSIQQVPPLRVLTTGIQLTF